MFTFAYFFLRYSVPARADEYQKIAPPYFLLLIWNTEFQRTGRKIYLCNQLKECVRCVFREKKESCILIFFWSIFSLFYLHELKIKTIRIFKKDKLASTCLGGGLPSIWLLTKQFSCFTSWRLFKDPSSQRYILPPRNVWRKTKTGLFFQATLLMATTSPPPAMALDPDIPTSSFTRWVKVPLYNTSLSIKANMFPLQLHHCVTALISYLMHLVVV